MQFPTESGESERHLILLIFTENLKKSNEKDSEDTPVVLHFGYWGHFSLMAKLTGEATAPTTYSGHFQKRPKFFLFSLKSAELVSS
jgi:hypothetical protein